MESTSGPQTLEINEFLLDNFGYVFNEAGILVNPQTGNGYEFAQDYDHIADASNQYAQALLKESLGFEEVLLGPHCKIFLSPDFRTNAERCLIIIQGAGRVRAGLWTRKLAVNLGLDVGSMLPHVRSALDRGYSVIILDPNHSSVGTKQNKAASRQSKLDHVAQVWREFITRCPAKKLAVLAHSWGGWSVLHLLSTFTKDFTRRVTAVAFADSVHSSLNGLQGPALSWFQQNAKNWIKSKQPLGKEVRAGARPGCVNVSAGHPEHEYTSWAAHSEMFKFIDR